MTKRTLSRKFMIQLLNCL